MQSTPEEEPEQVKELEAWSSAQEKAREAWREANPGKPEPPPLVFSRLPTGSNEPRTP